MSKENKPIYTDCDGNCSTCKDKDICDTSKKEAIDHPAHYNMGKYEVIDVIEDWDLGLHLGTAIKYIARAKHKENEIQDLRKAIWYIKRKIIRLEIENE